MAGLMGKGLIYNRVSQIASVIKRKRLGLSLLLVAASLTLSITAAEAFQIKVFPETPRLGDTVTVHVLSDQEKAPTITVGETNYPLFLIRPNKYRGFVPTTPLNKPGSITIKVTTSEGKEKLTLPLKNRNFPLQKITIRKTSSLSATDAELSQVREFKKIVSPDKLWSGKFRAPNAGRVSSVYGVRRYYNGVFAKDYYHSGVDYAGGYGSPVVAPASGKVVLVGYESKGFRVHGNTIGIDHGQGVLSIFLHLSSINVKEGQLVKPGDKIGAIGSSGASTGPHLHWGVYVNGVAVDPSPWRFKSIE